MNTVHMADNFPAWPTRPEELRSIWPELKTPEGEVLHQYFDQRPLAHHDLSWIDHFVELVEVFEWNSSISQIRSFFSDQAWRDRQRMGLLEWQDDFLQLSTHTSAEKFRIYYLGPALRFDFRLSTMTTATSEWIRRSRLNHEADDIDALLLALHAFATLEREPDEGKRFIEQAMSSPNASVSSRNTCLHAAWLAKALPQQGELMLELVRQKKAAGDVLGAVEYFWMAKAHRLLRDFPSAFSSIDMAFDLLTPNVDILSIHQDFVRERENILIAAQTAEAMETHLATVGGKLKRTGEELSEQVAHDLEDAKAKLIAETDSAEKKISESLFNVVSILGIFIGIVGLLASTGGIIAQSSFTYRADAILIVVTGLVIILMFFLLRMIVGSVFRKK